MSRSWAGGSTTRWRKTRLTILARDGWQCQIQGPHCTARSKGDLMHQQAHVHHTHGRSQTGDDPTYLQAACRTCNLSIGDPTTTTDPTPQPRTRW